MKAQIISFHCVMKNVLGQVLSTSFNQEVITKIPSGGREEVPGLSAGLQEVKAGEHRKISVSATEAYGLYDLRLVREASRKSLKSTEDLAVGDRVHLRDSFGDFRLYRITKIIGDLVYLDANHPLAGQDLLFEVHVVAAREATAEEIHDSADFVSPFYLQ
jgi:FKBP-type peptidyl-prolyl cis-trans isomerase SlyD